MLIFKYLFALLLVSVATLCSSSCFSQTQITEIKDSTGLRSYAVVRGDTLLIRYDSAYVLNKKTFRLYQENYRRVQNGNPSQKKLLEEYENLISLQDSMLKAKEEYYQGLKSNLDSLVTHSNRFVNKTDLNITAINQSLTNATGQLNNIKTLLDASLEKLKLENKQKLKWAFKGFGVGVGIAAITFLIAR